MVRSNGVSEMAIYSLTNEIGLQGNLAGTPGTTIVVAQTQTEGATSTQAGSGNGAELGTTTGVEVAKEGTYPFPPFDASTFGPQLFWLTITFGVLYVLMAKLALPRIGEILEVRRDRIEGDLAEAERLRQKTDQAIAAYESELAEARAKSHAIAEETRINLKKELDEKRREVEAGLSKTIASAEARIQKTKSDALSNVDEIAAETAVALVAKLTGKVSVKAARDAVASIVKG